MSKVLLITSGLTGILHASYELANRLQRKGHLCKILTPRQVRDKVISQGFEYHQLPSISFEPVGSIPKFKGPFGKIKRLFYKYRNKSVLQKEGIEALHTNEFLEIIKSESPDLVMIDIELHEYIMTLIVNDFKTVLLSQWFSTWKRKGLPPIVTNVIPGIGFQGTSLGIWLSWKRIELKRSWMFSKKKWMSAWTDRRSILLAYAKQIGFPKLYIPDNYWPGPFTYDLLPVIATVSRELEFPHSIRPGLHYAGPMVFESRKEPEKVERYREAIHLIKNQKKTNQKVIYCSISTFMAGDVKFLYKLVEAVRGQNDWILIIGLGGNVNVNDFKDTPYNVHVFDFVPQLEVLKMADLSINHGGIHTINECMHFGVPMLVYSGKYSDQNGCAARVHYHQVGMMGDKDSDSSAEIKSKIQSVINNESYKRLISIKLEKERNRDSKRLFQLIDEYGQ